VVCELIPLYGFDGMWNEYKYTRDLNEFTKLALNLNCEMWADVFIIEDDVNLIFNNFLNT
jgi:hypothetical protein